MTGGWNPLRDIAESFRTGLRTLTAQPRHLVYAVMVHAGFLLALMLSFQWSTIMQPSAPQVDIIEATLVNEAEVQKQIDKLREAENRKREEEDRLRRQREEARQAQEARKHEEQRQAELKEQQARQAEEMRRREEQRLTEVKKQQEEARKKEEQRQAEAKKQEEEARKREEQRQTEVNRQEEAQRQRAEEQRAREAQEAAQRARREQTEIDRYVLGIQQQVTRNWNKPENWRKGQECTVRVSIIPGGDVVGVAIVRSCGDPLFDRSVDSAVRKASPLKVPPADNPLFDRFRELEFVFKPES